MVDTVFRMVKLYNPKFWIIENPVGRLVNFIGKPKVYFNPCDYAGYLDNPKSEAYTKKTGLWGDFVMPEKKPIQPEFVIMKHGKRMSKMHYDSLKLSAKDRSNVRSKTPLGFAKAFVEVTPRKIPFFKLNMHFKSM